MAYLAANSRFLDSCVRQIIAGGNDGVEVCEKYNLWRDVNGFALVSVRRAPPAQPAVKVGSGWLNNETLANASLEWRKIDPDRIP